jgi:CBS-domain-containing membrane protein
MGALSAIHFGLASGSDMTMIVGSMGASAVLVFGANQVPFAQPRNVGDNNPFPSLSLLFLPHIVCCFRFHFDPFLLSVAIKLVVSNISFPVRFSPQLSFSSPFR